MNNYPKYVEIEGKRYSINTDFRYALKCNQIAEDETINDYERALAIIYTLFGDEGLYNTSHHEKLLKMAKKYLSCGKEVELTNDKPDMDYIEDYPYIKTSFRSDYGINLDNEKMHWWEFFELMNGLSNSEMGNCCILNRIRNLRNYDTREIKDTKERRKIEEAKKQVALKQHKKEPTEEQKKSAEEFFKALNIGKE